MKEMNYVYYNKNEITFEQMLQLEYEAMVKASLNDDILFMAVQINSISNDPIFISLN
jgi:hypothetical protein